MDALGEDGDLDLDHLEEAVPGGPRGGGLGEDGGLLNAAVRIEGDDEAEIHLARKGREGPKSLKTLEAGQVGYGCRMGPR